MGKAKVKRPTSAWIYFTNENRKKFQEKHPDKKMTDLTTLMSEEWKKLPEAQKKKYEDLAAKDKKRYEDEKANAPEETSSDESDSDDKKGKRKGKRAKKAKDPDAPKRPASAWMLYLNEQRPIVRGKAEHKDKKITEITTIISEQWKKESQATKDKFDKQAKQLKEKYEKDKAAYDKKKGAEDSDDSDAPPKKKAKGKGKKKDDSDSE